MCDGPEYRVFRGFEIVKQSKLMEFHASVFEMNQCLSLCRLHHDCTAKDHEFCVAGYLSNSLMRIPRYTGICTALTQPHMREACERLESVSLDFDESLDQAATRRFRAFSAASILLEENGVRDVKERWMRTELPRQMMTCIDVMQAMMSEDNNDAAAAAAAAAANENALQRDDAAP